VKFETRTKYGCGNVMLKGYVFYDLTEKEKRFFKDIVKREADANNEVWIAKKIMYEKLGYEIRHYFGLYPYKHSSENKLNEMKKSKKSKKESKS